MIIDKFDPNSFEPTMLDLDNDCTLTVLSPLIAVNLVIKEVRIWQQ
jgi:hypothetical protein